VISADLDTWHSLAIRLTQEIDRHISIVTDDSDNVPLLTSLHVALLNGKQSHSNISSSPSNNTVAAMHDMHFLCSNIYACGFVLVGPKIVIVIVIIIICIKYNSSSSSSSSSCSSYINSNNKNTNNNNNL